MIDAHSGLRGKELGFMAQLAFIALLISGCGQASEAPETAREAPSVRPSATPPEASPGTRTHHQPSAESHQDPTRTLKVTGGTELHDFGTISDLEHVTFNYKIVNISDQSIDLTSIKSPCGCARGKAVPATLQPGATGEIQASFYPQGRQGRQSKVLTVSTNRAGETPLELTLACDILPTVLIEPRNLAFRPIERGQASEAKRLTVTIRSAGKQLTKITSRDPRFIVKPIDNQRVTEGDEAYTRYDYEISFTGAPTADRYRGYLLIETDIPTHKQMQVSAYATVIGPVALAPDQVGIGRLTPGSSFERIIRVSHREAKPLQVEQVSFEGPAHVETQFKMLPPDPRMKGVTQIKFSGTVHTPPTAKANSITRVDGQIIIKTSLAEQPEVRARINGWVVPHK